MLVREFHRLLFRIPSVTYYVRAEGMCNITQCVSTAITVNTLSTQAISITSTNAEICYGSPATLSINGGSAGAGANWNWYSSSCGGTWLVSGISAVLSPSVTTDISSGQRIFAIRLHV